MGAASKGEALRAAQLASEALAWARQSDECAVPVRTARSTADAARVLGRRDEAAKSYELAIAALERADEAGEPIPPEDRFGLLTCMLECLLHSPDLFAVRVGQTLRLLHDALANENAWRGLPRAAPSIIRLLEGRVWKWAGLREGELRTALARIVRPCLNDEMVRKWPQTKDWVFRLILAETAIRPSFLMRGRVQLRRYEPAARHLPRQQLSQ